MEDTLRMAMFYARSASIQRASNRIQIKAVERKLYGNYSIKDYHNYYERTVKALMEYAVNLSIYFNTKLFIKSIFGNFFTNNAYHGHMRFVERKHHHPFIDPMERIELWCRCDHCGQPVKINIEWLTNACESINSMVKFTQRYRLAELWSHKLVTWCTHCKETIRLKEFFTSLHFQRYIPTTVHVATELGRKKYLNENVYDWDKMNKLESDFQNMSTVEFASTYDMDMDGDVLNVTLIKRGDALNVIPIKRYTEYPWLQKEVKHGKRKHHN